MNAVSMDFVRVIVSEPGSVIGLHSERVVIRSRANPKIETFTPDFQLLLPFADDDESGQKPAEAAEEQSKEYKTTEVPLLKLSEIIICSRGVSISTDIVEECCLRGIPITLLEFSGKPYAQITSPMLNATIVTRREQFKSYEDKRGLILSKKIIYGKLKNQANLIKYYGKYLSNAKPEIFRATEENRKEIESLAEYILNHVDGQKVEDKRLQLMTLEAKGAHLYWNSVKSILSDKIEFQSREHRRANDPVNAALNYGYGILYSKVWYSISLAGLDPYAGFLHADRPGKPSMVLDMIEEFRQPCVDRAIIAYFNKSKPFRIENSSIDLETRRSLAIEVGNRLDSAEPYRGRKLRLSSIIQAQARRAASFIRGESDYEPYIMRW